MKLPFPHRRPRDDGHLIPLINVIFLMLIFFMLMGRIKPKEPLEVAPPASRSGRETAELDVVLLLDAEGRLALGERRIEAGALVGALAELGEAGALHLTIKADAELTAGRLRETLAILRGAGIAGVDLMTVGRR